MMGVKFTGDWDYVNTYRNRIIRGTEEFGEGITSTGAKEYLKTVKQTLASGYAATPLKATYLKIKSVVGLNADSFWTKSGGLMSKLKAEKIGKHMWFAGAPADEPHGTTTVAMVAMYDEYGTWKNPPRRLFGPAKIKFFPRYLKFVQDEAKKMLTQDSYRNGRVINNNVQHL
jgi:hypothetical protein